MALQDVATVVENIKNAIGFNAGDIGYYLAAAGLMILVLAAVFVIGAIIYRGLKSISYMETGEFARFLIISAIVLLVLGAIWP